MTVAPVSQIRVAKRRRVSEVVEIRRRLTGALFAAGGLLIVLGLWALAHAVSNPTKVPSPTAVLSAIVRGWSGIPAVTFIYFRTIGIRSGLEYTIVNVLVGVGIGSAAGILLGLLIARVRTARLLIQPALLVVGTVPLLIILPFITFWFGAARFAQSGLVIVFALLTVTVATQGAAQAVSEHYTNFAASLGASPGRIVGTVILPAAMPGVVAAVRLALAAGWGWEVIAEQLGAKQGLGLIIQVTAQLDATADLVGAVLCLAVAAVLVDTLAAAGGGFLTRWSE